MRDFYEVLQVSRDASDADIKKAYRRLAMEYHPDRNPGDKKAEELFKEASTAYQVLSDPNQRSRYDRFGHEGLKGGGTGFEGFRGVDDIFSAFGDLFGDFFGGGGRRSSRGADLRVELSLTFAEAVWGATKEVDIVSQVACSTCSGSGAKPGTSPTTCGTCEGKGQVLHSQGFFMIQTTCPQCRGQGRIVESVCDTCRGRGLQQKKSKLSVTVPAGVDNGQTLRLSGKGEVSQQGGPPGNLYVVLLVASDERFHREEDSILTEVPISYLTAALGGEVTVPTLDNDCQGEATLKVKAGTQPGAVVLRRGEGIPRVNGRGRGDHAIQFKVEIPTELHGREEELLREIATERGEQVAEEKRGLFGRKRR